MKGGIYIDSESSLVQECFAVVHSVARKRKRFPEDCVQEVADEEAARSEACPEEERHPALVVGPSRSSEGVRLYYLVRWL
jgi:hypothetical protein